MQRLLLSVPDPAINLALDEALLDAAEADDAGEVLRVWEFGAPAVVVGRGSRLAAEVDVPACVADGVPVLRRTTGGLAIVAGPGCLLYSLVLDLRLRPALRMLDAAHRFVMEALLASLEPVIAGLAWQGTCDLTWGNRKVSGNSLRVARHHLLYHGTLLYGLEIARVTKYLRAPHREPEYRQHRTHDQFIVNLPVMRRQLVTALEQAFPTSGVPSPPLPAAAALAESRYRDRGWTERH
jgi:lipoate-protein ligase A